ncbi:MAG TPA: glutamate racemase [Ramlibacter sp.]|uniref:glutamate racemase n=1 Tax=Ramlibacter sp. TaxID=1917967 RepID=UPI002CAA185F|nr:glutamate racemase [Ramlibacter sp.]HVZ43443.1 glutamate racemase [Ramlibacter sp.]
MHPDLPIGVFDSGIGGLSVLRALVAELPHEDFIYYADTAHAPYGERGDPYVIERSHAIVDELVSVHRVKALVVACNTATAAAIHLLRERYPQLPIVGVEPALKPAAALTRTKRVGVLATQGTLSSAKFQALHDSLRHACEFILQPCPGLADAIENFDAVAVARLAADYVGKLGRLGTEPGCIDTLVLGCTHYPFAEREIRAAARDAVTLLETGAPVARRTRELLHARGLLRASGEGGRTWLTSGRLAQLQSAAARWL